MRLHQKRGEIQAHAARFGPEGIIVALAEQLG